jgi:hypothetical protein
MKRVLTKVKQDKDLATQVEQLKLKESNADEAWQRKDESQETVKIKGEANAIFLESFHTGQIHPLKLSTILDLGTTLHIFNNISRFYNFSKALRHEYVIAGSLEVPILGYGDVNVQVIRPDKSKGILRLKDVAFYTDFNTNLVSFRLLRKRGYY